MLSIEVNRIPKVVLWERARNGKIAYDQLELMKKMIKLKKELIDIQEKQVRNYNAYHSFQKIMKLEDIMQFAEARFKTMQKDPNQLFNELFFMDKFDKGNGKKK